jgi:hypothetical protein
LAVGAKDSISQSEAARAIYIDFEGRTNELPVLLGVLYAEGRRHPDPHRLVLRHDVIDPAFGSLTDVVPVKCEEYLYRYDSDVRHRWVAVREVVRRAEHQDRLIVAWSQHELSLVREACAAQGLSDAFEQRFRDGKATARRWLRETHPDLVPERGERGGAHRLAHYLPIVGWEVPAEFGPGRVGGNLKLLREALGKGRSWNSFTDRQRRAWWQVLGHNLHDCLGLRAVVMASATSD